MIENFSPLTRRLLAAGLLLLAVLLALRLAGVVIDAVGGSLDRLQDSRFARARVEAVRTRPPPPAAPPLPPGQFLQAESHEAAADAAAARLRGAASQASVTLDAVTPVPEDTGNPRLVRLTFTARAPEPALLAFIQAVERDDPPLRLHGWSIVPAAPGAAELTLQANAVAAWSAAP